MVLQPAEGEELEVELKKDGIPRTTPLRPKPQVPSLPSILCSHNQTSISEYSKALRGLSVLPHVARICTGTAISPNPSLSCLLYTSDAADDLLCVDLGGRRIIKKKKINYDEQKNP